MAALGFIVLLVLVAIIAPLIVDAARRARPERAGPTRSTTSACRPPAAELRAPLRRRPDRPRRLLAHDLRRARLARPSRCIATALIVVSIGTVAGMIAGFYRGWVDTVLSRIMDVQLAFPVLLLAIGLGAACSLGGGCLGGLIQPGLPVVIFVIVARPVALHRAHHPRAGPVAAREGVHRGGPLARARRTPASSSARSSPTCWPRSSSTRR